MKAVILCSIVLMWSIAACAPPPTAALSPTPVVMATPPSPNTPPPTQTIAPTTTVAATQATPTVAAQLRPVSIPLPDGAGEIGFDDLNYDPALGQVLVPAGRTGNLDLIDPKTQKVKAISGFTAQSKSVFGHSQGTTSADAANKFLVATDRNVRMVDVVDPSKASIVASASLGGNPDYVRYVSLTNELWVTEPDSEQIEVLALNNQTPAHKAFIAVPGGPESLVIDIKRHHAYTHLWSNETVAINVDTHTVIAHWTNGCHDSRGIALDEARGFLFVGCEDGQAVVLDMNNNGKQLSTLKQGSGVDVISYNAKLAHLYVPGAASRTMAILGVSATGELSLLGTAATAADAHCVVADDQGNAWVCNPDHGQILLFKDPFPPSGR